MKAEYDDIVDIIQNANTMVELDGISPQNDLRDLGADSLDLMNILLSVQEKFGIEIPDTELENLTTIESICNFVNKSV